MAFDQAHLALQAQGAFGDQVRRTIERVERGERIERRRTPTAMIEAARAADSGKGPPVALEDPLRIARRAVSAGLAPTVGAVLAPADGTSTSDALAVAYEKVLGQANFLGSGFLFAGAARAEAVCRVVIRTPTGAVAGYGTGFMVSPSSVMTNNHVLDSAATAGQSVIQFGYRERAGGTIHPVAEFALEPARLFVTDVHLDVTVVAVAASNPAGQLVAAQGWVPLVGPTGKTLIGERVNIIQHPSGEPQQVVIHDNLVVELVDDFLRYVADTQPGSSGSPVFNNDWDLAALHHSGVPRTDPQGRILLTTGDVWDGSEAKRDLIDWVSNEGVRVSSIVDFLGKQPASAELDAVLHPAPSPAFEAALPGTTGTTTGTTGTAGAIGTVGPAIGPRLDGTTARWHVPVEVQLDLGALAGAPAPAAHVTVAEGEAPTAPTPSPAAYYDEAADQRASDAYYAGVDPDAGTGALYRQLGDLTRTAHTHVLEYTEARLDHLYPLVDLHPDGTLHNVYSDTTLDPQEVIAADREVEAQRSARLQQLVAAETALTAERLEEFAAGVEAEFFFNCEHVVPQSWFAKKQPMRGDLHHLFTCEPGCNSFRSNIPYWDFPPQLEALRTDCGRLEGRRFEPEAHHGAVARATLYFLVRYPGLIAPTEAEMPTDRLPMILQWHRANPPSVWERHRNATTARIQGNRNPFIDHPDWTDKVDFALGFAA